ncbi:Predicted DNA-binding protein, MmcQ/YjbR family [Thermoflexibacter ruber]|uniref:Predicted DNA-binding protein, MmcQ/YjbR family n=1 Tax=Thermoflexibacter ruber TaxID=1003 RepID=A0A1I2J7A8_9BACT|nr:Predicted DNA-binding protein, MmcQ/YjbR family [Thermoflexibacter ruber]
MNIEEFREFCLNLKGVTESTHFDDNTLVMKVMSKVFAIADIDKFESINVKCEPETAIDLRERYSGVTAGYHMNKKHWNTIAIVGELSDEEIKHWILHSYDLVVSKLTKKEKNELNEL